MRSVLKLIAFSLLLAGCSQPLEVEQQTAADPIEPLVSEVVDIESLVADYDDLINCEEYLEISEGDFQTVVCSQGVIRFWEGGLDDSSLAPWMVWCQPALAAGGEPEFEVLLGEQYVVENRNPETIGSSNEIDLCVDISNREFGAFDPNSQGSYALLTNLAQSGVCFEPPTISVTSPLRHICSGFGLGEEEFTLWLETGEVSELISEYSSECGAGIAGTYSDNWLISTYDIDAVIGGETLQKLLGLISPVPFSNLCESEETS